MKSYHQISDMELFALLKQGDQVAFLEIYDRYKTLLQNHALKKLHDLDEVEDILQELFVNIWEKRITIQLTTSLANYLYTATRNRIFNHYYRRQREGRYLDSLAAFIEKGECITELTLREKEFSELIQKEINALPPRMREVFSLHRSGELTYREIAEQLGTSELTVATQIKKALKVLRLRLGANLFFLFMIF